MLALEVKGLAYESKLLEFSKDEHKTPSYLKLNPRGKVPTLKDGDFVIYESVAIMAYLDRKYPDPPLFGETPEETGLICRALAEMRILHPARRRQSYSADLLWPRIGQSRRDPGGGANSSPRAEDD
jgi:glutathione S-transferase